MQLRMGSWDWGETRTHNGVEYTHWTVPSNERLEFRVEDGDVIENHLFDITSSGSGAAIVPSGSWGDPNAKPRDFTIRNIGWDGGQGRGTNFQIRGGTRGESLVENIYAGHGSEDDVDSHDVGSQPGHMLLSPASPGTLTIRNAYVEGHNDNGLYCSNPGENGYDNAVIVENSYVARCISGNIRVSGTDVVRDCVAVGGVPVSVKSRGIWNKSAGSPSNVTVENCNVLAENNGIALTAGGHTGATITLYDTQYDCSRTFPDQSLGNIVDPDGTSGCSPTEFVPEGVPTSPLEAATGEGGGGPSVPMEDVTLLTQPGADLHYFMRFDGDARRANQPDSWNSNGDITAGGSDDETTEGDGWTEFAGTLSDGRGHGFEVAEDAELVDYTFTDPSGSPLDRILFQLWRSGTEIETPAPDPEPEPDPPIAAFDHAWNTDRWDVDASPTTASARITAFDWWLTDQETGDTTDTASGETATLVPGSENDHRIVLQVTDENGMADTQEATLTPQFDDDAPNRTSSAAVGGAIALGVLGAAVYRRRKRSN